MTGQSDQRNVHVEHQGVEKDAQQESAAKLPSGFKIPCSFVYGLDALSKNLKGWSIFRRAPILSRFATDSFEMARFAHMRNSLPETKAVVARSWNGVPQQLNRLRVE